MDEEKNMPKNEKAKETKVKKQNSHNKLKTILVGIFLIIAALVEFVMYRGDYLQTLSIGEQYLPMVNVKYKFIYITMAVVFAVMLVITLLVNRSIKKGLVPFFKDAKKEMPKLPNKSIAVVLSALVAMITSGLVVDKLMLISNNTLFGITDPIFNSDVGFYMFQKPFIEFVLLYFIFAIVGIMAYTVVYYLAVFNICLDGIERETLKKNSFIKQLLKYAFVAVLGIAALVVVKTQGIVTDKFLTMKDDLKTEIIGAGLTQATIKVWGYRLLAVVIVVSVLFAIKNFKKRNSKKTIISLLGVPAYLVAMFIIMEAFNLIFVKSNEFDTEKKYIKDNIEYTKSAYNIAIDENNIEDTETISIDEATKNKALINNIPVITSNIVATTENIQQTSAKYYSFREARLATYSINGQDKTVYVSPREIVSNGNKSYNNKTYQYTHGFGVVIASATTTDENGNVDYIQKEYDGSDEQVKVSEPRVYFGLDTTNTIVTNVNGEEEFDYPTNSDYAVNTYNGEAGLKLNFIDRLILAIKEKDMKILTSANSNNTIVTDRNVIERAKAIMPYLQYDENPYTVVTDNGRLVWVLDAYTISNDYPYSQSTVVVSENRKQSINYIRNSVKVTVDAYDGTINFYLTDKTDPIAMAYNNMYEGLFKSQEEIPSDIANHFVYPKYLYDIQARVLSLYHNVTADVLYRGDDAWSIATKSTNKTEDMDSYYTMLKLPDSDENQFGLVIPYTAYEKENINAYLVGITNGTSNKLRLYKFSSDSNVVGPTQLEKQINEDTTIANTIKEISVSGTKIVKDMIIVPVNNTLLYVEPIYQISLNETKSLPVLKKVVVASGNKVAIGDNLQSALNNLLYTDAVNIEVDSTDTVEGLTNLIIKANTNLNESKKNNDWEMMGKDLNKLQDLINKLEKVQEEEDKKALLNDKDANNGATNDTNANIIANNLESSVE